MNTLKVIAGFIMCSNMIYAQSIQLSEVIMLCNSSLKENSDPQAFQSYMLEEFIPAWNSASNGSAMYLLKSDRGDKNGEYLTACVVQENAGNNLSGQNVFADQVISSNLSGLSDLPSQYLSDPGSYTEYQLIGAENFEQLPKVDLLGIHYLKIKSERAKEFEKLVVDKLHPTVGDLVFDMNLLYYKATNGQQGGSYITIYAIESVEARERFWPTGGEEQDIVKQLFRPYRQLALELSSYLVEDSYLGPESGGGAAYFESLEWTDYVIVNP